MTAITIPPQTPQPDAESDGGRSPAGIGLWWIVLPIVLAPVAGSLVTALVMRDRHPGDRSVEAGFLRDMSTHHGQAVRMAGIAYRRTEDEEIKWLAYDILTTQQGQIGIMFGWLNAWGLPAASLDPPMTWMDDAVDHSAMPGMDHSAGASMPGMATDEEIVALEALPPAEMDRLFLELMLEHHIGGVEMAQAALGRTSNDTIVSWAESIVVAQQNEIRAMEAMLGNRGA